MLFKILKKVKKKKRVFINFHILTFKKIFYNFKVLFKFIV